MPESTFEKALRARRNLEKAKAAYERAQKLHEQAYAKAVDELCEDYRKVLANPRPPEPHERIDVRLQILSGTPCQNACAQAYPPIGSAAYNSCLLANGCYLPPEREVPLG